MGVETDRSVNGIADLRAELFKLRALSSGVDREAPDGVARALKLVTCAVWVFNDVVVRKPASLDALVVDDDVVDALLTMTEASLELARRLEVSPVDLLVTALDAFEGLSGERPSKFGRASAFTCVLVGLAVLALARMQLGLNGSSNNARGNGD